MKSMPSPSSLSHIPLALASWAVLAMAGCFRGIQVPGVATTAAERAQELARHTRDNATSIGGLGNIALGFIALGGLALVLSFVPVVSVFVPRKAAIVAIIFGGSVYVIGGFFAGFMAKFGDAIYWGLFAVLVIAGACAVWPVLVAAHKGTLWMKSKELLAAGHVAEAAAFQITATPGASESPSIRKQILAKLESQAPPPTT